MILQPKILWIITARSGSKSIRNKNIKKLDGHPLMSYIIKSVINSNFSESIYISTDSIKYAKIAESYGAKFEFLRPDSISKDNSSSVEAILHAIKETNNQKFDYVGLLEPSTPFINSNHINKAVEKLISDKKAEALVAVKKHRPNTIFVQEHSKYLVDIYKKISKNENLMRQSFEDQITPCGGLYLSEFKSFLKNKSFYTEKTIPFLIEDINSIEIDEPIDFLFAEFLLKTKKIGKLF